MFERYTERARRAVYFARREATEWSDSSIGVHHLLFGVMREDPNLMVKLFGSNQKLLEVYDEIAAQIPRGSSQIPTEADMPLDHSAQVCLSLAAEEVERLKIKQLDTGHLMLGILRSGGPVADILKRHNLDVVEIRGMLARAAPAPAPSTPADPAPSPQETLAARQELHQLVDRLPDSALATAKLYLEFLQQRGHA